MRAEELNVLAPIEPQGSKPATHFLLASNTEVWAPTIIEAKATAEKNEDADGWHVGTGCRFPGSLRYEFTVYVKDPEGRGVCWQMTPDNPAQDPLAPRNQTSDKIIGDLLFGSPDEVSPDATALLRKYHSAVVLAYLAGPAWTKISPELQSTYANAWSIGAESLVLASLDVCDIPAGYHCDPWNIGTGGPAITVLSVPPSEPVTARM